MKLFFNKLQPLFIGLCAGCMAAQTLFLLEKSVVLTNQYPLFVGLLTVFGYHFLLKNRFKKTVGWLAGLAAVVLFFKNKWPIDRLQIGLLAFSASYYFPPARKFFSGETTSLRASTFGKPVAIGLVWAAVTIVPPFLYFEKRPPPPALFLMFAERFLFIAPLALGYDLIDENADRAAGLRTIPVRFGAFFTKKLMVGLLFAALFPVAGEVVFGFYSVKIASAVGLSLIVAAGLTLVLPSSWRQTDAKMLVDATMLIQFLGVALAVT